MHDNCYYHAPVTEFLLTDDSAIMGQLEACDGKASKEQVFAWDESIKVLKSQLSCYQEGEVALEFTVPRIGHRIDAVFIHNGIIFIIEFKCGMKNHRKETYEQVLNYANDLHFFHIMSEGRLLVPIMLPTDAPDVGFDIDEYDDIINPIPCNRNNLSKVIDTVCSRYRIDGELDIESWLNSEYRPTPSIIEATCDLFRNHSVEDIKRHDSVNLGSTIECIEDVISDCRRNHKKAVCFVTGVPGAGKTLVGLTLAIRNSDSGKEERSVFLSGNEPLVETLREALVRDAVEHKTMKEPEAVTAATSFIQNIHHFRSDSIKNPSKTPDEHVVIFDEAQRAWTAEKLNRFVKKTYGSEYNLSEPESLLSSMDRHQDWAVVVCLVGGGQEIYDGEAGISEWFDALRRIPGWEVHATPHLDDPVFTRGTSWDEITRCLDIRKDDDMHLSISMRTLRTDRLNAFVRAVLDCDIERAESIYSELGQRYPVTITRNLESAKKWIATISSPNERYGMVESSNTARMVGNGIKNQNGRRAVAEWMLEDRNNASSSCSFSEAASEFQIQGLELDYVILRWGTDMLFHSEYWHFGYSRSDSERMYLKNAYRVLMTRARKGMVIFIPENPGSLQETFDLFKRIGIRRI